MKAYSPRLNHHALVSHPVARSLLSPRWLHQAMTLPFELEALALNVKNLFRKSLGIAD